MADIEEFRQLKIIHLCKHSKFALDMIKVRFIVLVLLVFVQQVLFAQSDLMIHGSTPSLYLSHKVEPKETWYSIGRMYNLSPKEIAAFNQTSMDKSLSIAQVLRIPLKPANFSQNNAKSADEVLVPLYHTVAEREWMYRISVNHNKVPIESIEKWNNISRDHATAGTKLIVGFLKVKKNLSPLASNAYQQGRSAVASNSSNTPSSEPVSKATEITKTDSPSKGSSTTPVFRDNSTIPKETPKTEAASASMETKAPVNYKGGYFRSQYDASGKSTSGVSGIFKSTSGWNDGKYYALMNNVPVGTIVKVNFPSTTKTIYAKVLGQLPDMRESVGLTIRISEAAATELGAGNSKFTVEVDY